MISYDMAGVADDDTTRKYNDLDAFTYETPGYGITVGVEIDRTVCLHLTHEIGQLTKWRTASQRPQGIYLASEALDWRFTRRAVVTLIGDLTYPTIQMCLEGGPTLKSASRDGVLFDVTDPAFILSLGPGPIWSASAWHEAPVPRKCP